MAEFLKTLLLMSLLGSALAVLLTLLRPLIAGRRVYYCLWLLVLARLCLPVGVAIPLPGGEQAQAPAAETISEAWTAEPAWQGSGLRPGDAAPSPARPEATARPEPAPQAAPAAGWRALLTAPELWFAVWAAGAAFCLGRSVYGYRRFAGLVRATACPPEPAALETLARLDPSGRTALLVCPHAPAPLLLGAARPVIVLPEGVEADRLADILAHELTHARRHDLLYKWLTAAVTALHWFNPVMILVRRQVSRACELSCDEAVVWGMDAAGRKHYGETLLALAARSARGTDLVAALGEGREHLKERLVSVMDCRRPGPAALALTVILSLVLTGCAAIFGAEPSAGPDPSPSAAADQGTLLADPVLYELDGGLTAALPADLADQITVIRPEGGPGFLAIYETRSYEAAGEDLEMGWICSLARYDQVAFEESLTADNSGRHFFARGDGWYYAVLTPTDVRFYSEDPPEEQEAQAEAWGELCRRLPEEVPTDFIARNGLEAFTSADAFHDGCFWDGAHEYIHYRTDDWSESVTLLLSQPARQGEGGVWCVEGCFYNQYGTSRLVLPRDTGMTAADYYARVQEAVDRGERPELLTPEGAARAWIESEYGAVSGPVTPVEGTPAWDLWSRVVDPIQEPPGTLTRLVYVDGAETETEDCSERSPYNTALWTRVWVEAEGPEVLNGPALVYTSEHPDTAGDRLIFPEAGGLLGIQRDGTLTWYRGAYDYAESPYELMEAVFEAWRAQQEPEEPVEVPQDALARVFETSGSLELYGFKEPGSSPWVMPVSAEELPDFQAIFDSCTWEEAAERSPSEVKGEPPSGCHALCLVGNGQLQLEWVAPCVQFGGRYWRCTGDYDGFYARLAALWAEKQAMDFPNVFLNAVVRQEGALALQYQGATHDLSDGTAVAELVRALSWTPAAVPADPGEGVAVSTADRSVTVTFYPGNLVYYYRDSYWNFWYQGAGEADVGQALLGLWQGAGNAG